MVDFSHLSAGNSLSSHSPDVCADYGISPPVSPRSVKDSDLGGLSSTLRLDLAAKAPRLSSSDGSSEGSFALDSSAPRLGNEEISEIFRATQQLTHKDRLEAVEERKKNLDLIRFIHSKGLSLTEVNDFIAKGSVSSPRDEYGMFSVAMEVTHDKIESGGPRLLCQSGSLEPLPPPSGLNGESDAVCGPSICPGSSYLDQNPLANHTLEAGELLPCNPTPMSCSGMGVGDRSPNVGTHTVTTGKSLPKSWSSLLSNDSSPNLNLAFFPPPPSSSSEPGPVIIQPPLDILKKGASLWNSSLIGHFVHSKLPYKVVESAAMRMWGKYGLQKIILHELGYYIFRFNSTSDRDNILALGPWYIANRLVKLQHWQENVNLSQEICTKTPVWVKLHHLPFSYWTEEGLSYVASGIGKPLFTDKSTAKLDPMPFARICVEMDISSAFPSTLSVAVPKDDYGTVEFVEVRVEYQNKPASCPTCQSFGHSKLKCPKANYQWVPKSRLSPAPDAHLPVVEGVSTAPVVDPSVGVVKVDPSIPTEEWIAVTRNTKNIKNPRDKGKVDASSTPVSNSFLPIDVVEDSDLDITPSPNPLVSKLISVDEKEGKDLKNKGRDIGEDFHVSKRRHKGGGKPSQIK